MTADNDRACPSLFLDRRAGLPLCAAFLIEPLGPGTESQLSVEDPEMRDAVEFVKVNTGVPFQDGRYSL